MTSLCEPNIHNSKEARKIVPNDPFFCKMAE